MTSANLEAFFAADRRRARRRRRQPLRRNDPALWREHHAGRRSAARRRGLPGLHGRCAADRAGGQHPSRWRSIRSAPATISGSARARRRASGQVVVDLGRKMNRILDIDEKLAFAVVEPGVSYQALYDELVRRGNKLMLDVTSGPPQGGMIGNALDKGAGYSPYFDHFGFSCGLEIVLGNGEVLRTGDGALDSKDLINWHTSKYSFGPILDGLFTQSNFGIVTRMGVWLLPRPPAVRSFHFAFPDDDDLETIVELCRPLKLSNFVPTLVPRVQRSLSVRLGGREPGIPGKRRQALDLRRGPPSFARTPRAGRLECVRRILRTERGGDGAANPARARHVRAKRQGTLYLARGCGGDPAAAGRDQRFFGRAEHGRAWTAEMASGRRQYLVPAGHADGRPSRQ